MTGQVIGSFIFSHTRQRFPIYGSSRGQTSSSSHFRSHWL